jgi:hypothetical protein
MIAQAIRAMLTARSRASIPSRNTPSSTLFPRRPRPCSIARIPRYRGNVRWSIRFVELHMRSAQCLPAETAELFGNSGCARRSHRLDRRCSVRWRVIFEGLMVRPVIGTSSTGRGGPCEGRKGRLGQPGRLFSWAPAAAGRFATGIAEKALGFAVIAHKRKLGVISAMRVILQSPSASLLRRSWMVCALQFAPATWRKRNTVMPD